MAVFLKVLGPDSAIKDYQSSISFSEKGFFLYILPPIIFCAGYTLHRKNFIRSLATIMGLGILGTVLAMVFISLLLYYANEQYKWMQPLECLLIAAVLCSTDTVAVLTLISANEYPTLNSVLFGEGVINDAVAILLFRAIGDLLKG